MQHKLSNLESEQFPISKIQIMTKIRILHYYIIKNDIDFYKNTMNGQLQRINEDIVKLGSRYIPYQSLGKEAV